MKLQEAPLLPPKILMYGPFGQGKTALVETLGNRIQLFDLDDGAKTGLYLNDKHQPARKEVDLVRLVEQNTAIGSAWPNLKSKIIEVSNQCVAKKYPFKAVCVDSLTSMGEAAMRYILGNTSRIGRQPTQPEWGLAILEIEYVMSVLKSLPLVVIVIAHEKNEEIDGRMQSGISVIGQKLPPKIPTYFDEVWYLRAEPQAGGITNFVIRTKSTGSITCRSRYHLQDGILCNIGLVEIFKKMGYDIDAEKPQEGGPTTAPTITVAPSTPSK